MSVELAAMGHQATICPDGLTAVAALQRNSYDCIIVDLDMPGRSGIEVLQAAKDLSPDTEAVILTGKASLETAVAALRQGAYDYLTKPCKLAELQAVLERVAQKRELTNKCRALLRRLQRVEGTPTLVGASDGIQRVRGLIAKVAPTASTVLIRGETGTGKELVARAIHDQSPRADMPLVAVNCGALPESLIESELFGHRKGSFTGADEHRVGLFEVAHGGTLFLDEIGELPKGMQSKLLRAMESGEIRRVGDNESRTVDVRVICATHRDLEEMVREGAFREDLMFRVNAFEIHLPPLRERMADVPALARHLLARFRPLADADKAPFTAAAMKLLSSHTWPGNVRELANVIEHATILCDDGPIDADHLPANFHLRRLRVGSKSSGPLTLRELEMQALHEALDRHSGNKPKAAEELGISLKTLYNKLHQEGALGKSA
jgi:two-component system NtrC family response regulator